MSSEQNRSASNLMLMCVEHASSIDDPMSYAHYPPTLLHEWKSEQVSSYERLQQGWTLDDVMSEEVLTKSVAPSVHVRAKTLILGGTGGNAPGAGGGGGGAIGNGARGGNGGNGGQTVTADIDLQPLYEAGWNGDAEVDIPEAGTGGSLPGEHGRGSGATTIKFRKHDGTLLRQLVAEPGMPGRSGASYAQADTIDFDEAEIDDWFSVTSLMPVNSVEIRDDLFFILGGGWDSVSINTLPTPVVWTFVCSANFSPIKSDRSRAIYLSINDPDGKEISCVCVNIPPDVLERGSIIFQATVGGHLTQAGLWFVCLYAGGKIVCRKSINVVRSTN